MTMKYNFMKRYYNNHIKEINKFISIDYLN